MLGCMKAPIQTVLLAHMPSALPEVSAWLFREWRHRNPGSSLERAILKVGLCSNVNRLPIALIAVVDGKPAGTASIVETENAEDEPGPWVSGVYVLPQHRGRKIATILMNRLEHEAIRLSTRQLLLSAAVPELHERLGYTATGAIKHGEPIMVKNLSMVSSL